MDAVQWRQVRPRMIQQFMIQQFLYMGVKRARGDW
jgi:hypothetical protein